MKDCLIIGRLSTIFKTYPLIRNFENKLLSLYAVPDAPKCKGGTDEICPLFNLKVIYLPTLISILEVLIVTVPVLLTVAYVTVAERKTMASMQRRLGPNIVGYYGLLQAFADALKLLLKEYVSPTQANMVLFFIGPIITLIFSLLGYSVIPYGPGLGLSDFDLGILYMLAVSSLSTYGILLAGSMISPLISK